MPLSVSHTGRIAYPVNELDKPRYASRKSVLSWGKSQSRGARVNNIAVSSRISMRSFFSLNRSQMWARTAITEQESDGVKLSLNFIFWRICARSITLVLNNKRTTAKKDYIADQWYWWQTFNISFNISSCVASLHLTFILYIKCSIYNTSYFDIVHPCNKMTCFKGISIFIRQLHVI